VGRGEGAKREDVSHSASFAALPLLTGQSLQQFAVFAAFFICSSLRDCVGETFAEFAERHGGEGGRGKGEETG
jgi:hypothetical protein